MFGSSTAPEACLHGVLNAIEKCYSTHGIRTFVVGHYGSFDRIAAHALTLLKARHPDGQETVIPRFAITTANNKMIRECAVAVCYPHGVTNSRKMYERVLKRNIPVYNITHNTEV